MNELQWHCGSAIASSRDGDFAMPFRSSTAHRARVTSAGRPNPQRVPSLLAAMCAQHGSVTVRERAASLSADPDATGAPSGPGASGVPGSPERSWTVRIPSRRAGSSPAEAAARPGGRSSLRGARHTVGLLSAGSGCQRCHARPPNPAMSCRRCRSSRREYRKRHRAADGEVQLTDAVRQHLQPVEGEIVVGMTHTRPAGKGR